MYLTPPSVSAFWMLGHYSSQGKGGAQATQSHLQVRVPRSWWGQPSGCSIPKYEDATEIALAGRPVARFCSLKAALVRLRGQWDRAVEVRFCAVKSRAVSNRNCVAAMRGGEQRNENDQSVTQVVQEDSRRELDSVGVDGRVFERKTKSAKRAIGASQIAGQPGGPRS